MILATFKLFKVLKDIKLYVEYLNVIKKEELDSPIWSRLGIRRDWGGRVYTVVNLPLSVIKSPDFPKEARGSFVFNEIKPINEYLKSLNLEEIITLWIGPVKDTDEESFLVIYRYAFRHLSLIWIFRFIIEMTGLTLGLIYLL